MTSSPSLAQIVAALSVYYSDHGVLIWLTGKRRDGPSMQQLIADGRAAEVAEAVRRIGDADPADFEVVQR